MKLIDFSELHFSTLAGWFSSDEHVVQWGGPLVHFPLDSTQLQKMIDDGRIEPPTRLCWMAEDERDLVGHAQLGFDWRNGNATISRIAIAPPTEGGV